VTPPICSLGAQPLPLGVVRAILSRSSDKITPVHKYYYSGPMFRYERPQKGRLRQVCVCLSIVWMHTEHVSPQFNQFGVELIGSAGWVADIEMITMASHFLDAIGLGGVVEVLDKSFFRVSNSLLHQLKINTLGDRASREAYRNVLVDYLRSVRGELSADSVQR